MTVFDYVKILADARNITISRLEKECGLGNATIKAWEKSYPKIDKLYKVSSFFDVPLEYFITGNIGDLSPSEKIIISAYQSTDDEGKARIIQSALNEQDRAKAEKNEDVAI